MGAIFAIIALVSTALLGASMPFLPGNTGDPNTEIPDSFLGAASACTAQVNPNRTLKVVVNSELDSVYGENAQFDWANKQDKTWVLVKENAPIAAWKVLLENHNIVAPRTIAADDLGEMENIGITEAFGGAGNLDGQGKEVYVGIGWCNPETGTGYAIGTERSCLDPLVQDVVFVVNTQGATLDDVPTGGEGCTGDTRDFWLCNHPWGEGTATEEQYQEVPRTQENLDKYWWTFNVYYDASKLPANPTYDDLPCWMKMECPNGGDVMGDNRLNEAGDSECEAENVLPEPGAAIPQERSLAENEQTSSVLGEAHASGGADPDRPRLIIKKSFMILDESKVPSGVTMLEEYISSTGRPTAIESSDIKIGTAYNNHFDVYLRRSNVSGTSADHALILDPTPAGHPEGPFWTYVPILQDSKPQGNSLQLGSFVPGIPSFFYEWWTPSCKPALYFYPEKETRLIVQVTPNGAVTESIPHHGEHGWTITASPDGTIYDVSNNQHTVIPNGYLYYEAAVKNLSVPKDTGWIKTTDELSVFFADVLPKLGLNETESTDFIEYWLPKLTQEGKKWFITLVDEKEVDRVEPITFSVQPDNVTRVRFYFENIDKKVISPVTTYKIPEVKPDRSGFTVVDWGGIMGNGSCGLEEISR